MSTQAHLYFCIARCLLRMLTKSKEPQVVVRTALRETLRDSIGQEGTGIVLSELAAIELASIVVYAEEGVWVSEEACAHTVKTWPRVAKKNAVASAFLDWLRAERKSRTSWMNHTSREEWKTSAAPWAYWDSEEFARLLMALDGALGTAAASHFTSCIDAAEVDGMAIHSGLGVLAALENRSPQ